MASDSDLLAYLGKDNLCLSKLLTETDIRILQPLIDGLSAEFGIASTLSDPDGSPVLLYANFTELCRNHIRSCPEGLQRCKEEARKRGFAAATDGTPAVYRCHANIIDFIAPIILLGQRIGNIAGGQVLEKAPDEAALAEYAQYFSSIGVADSTAAKSKLAAMPISTPDRVARLAKIYQHIGQLLSNYFRFQVEYSYWRDALSTANAELEDRVNRRTEALQAANDKLQQALGDLQIAQSQAIESERLASLGNLVAGFAHEINTPLGLSLTALSFLDTKLQDFLQRYTTNQLRRSDLDAFVQTSRDSIHTLTINIERAAGIVRSFKQVAVDQASEQRRRFKLCDYINDILTSLVPKLKRTPHKIQVDCDKTLEFEGNPGAFSQLLTNLIMNSIIHAFDPGIEGHIHITAQRAGDSLQLSVSDDGRGITPEHQAHLFEPFFTTKRGEGGTGLGLHIVHTIVTQQLGGTIQCVSSPGKGTTFHIAIPLPPQPAA